MAGLTVSRTQRAGARALLEETFQVANGPPSWQRQCYRQWLQTPSEGRRKLLGQAGVPPAQLAARVAGYLPEWRAQDRARAAASA